MKIPTEDSTDETLAINDICGDDVREIDNSQRSENSHGSEIAKEVKLSKK